MQFLEECKVITNYLAYRRNTKKVLLLQVTGNYSKSIRKLPFFFFDFDFFVVDE